MKKSRIILAFIFICATAGAALAINAKKYSTQGLYFCNQLGGLPTTYSTGYKTTMVTALGFNTFATTGVFLPCPATKVTAGF